MGGEFGGEWIHVYVWLSPFAVHQKLLQRCCSVVKLSDSLQPHGLQHTMLPCPSLSPEVCSNSCPLIGGCHPTISSSVAPFSCFQSFLASGFFPMSWLFTSGSQSIGASASVLPMNSQGWFPLRLTTTRAFAICLCGDWTLCCCSCWPATPSEGVQGGVRPSVLQGIWWNRSLDIFRNWFHDPNLCTSSNLENHLIPSRWHQLLVPKLL